MHIQLFILLISSMTIAFPLNINLGAFSPALVVGDGEISFAEGKQAEGLITSLSGSSAGVDKAGNNALNGVKIKEGKKGATVKARSIITEGDSDTKINMSSEISNSSSQAKKERRDDISIAEQVEIPGQSQKRSLEKRDLAGFLAALKFADGALNRGPSIDLGTGEGGSGVGISIRPPGTATKAAEE
ncbi:hypothetical protein OnM2_031020 [Erysiphe neolycopersici]|uniref:Uncharacterized protein n=1 Tax=Erysiphe neolycopersici TaxID=212602 RepID=A0A420HZ89_9PEZI|nr:hypothetical protein OnM2_031020 [Erysiphe neolycopersici]